MDIHCQDCADLVAHDPRLDRNRRRTQWVVVVTSLTMVLEIAVGYSSGSMALTADGWHMATHAGALLIALLAYRMARSQSMARRFSFGAGKLIPLGGYTSAVILAVVALLIVAESATRIASPVSINYDEAIAIACFGLLVNLISVAILHDPDDAGHGHSHSHGHGHSHSHGHGHGQSPDHGHSSSHGSGHGSDHHHSHDDHHDHPQAPPHKHKHIHDHNLRSAFLHIAADALTSVLAIAALICGKIWHVGWFDPFIGVVGGVMILVWAFFLCRDTGWELLDGHSKAVDWRRLRARVETGGARIVDFHVWRIAPQALACELVVATARPLGLDHYRELLKTEFSIRHIIVEERMSTTPV